MNKYLSLVCLLFCGCEMIVDVDIPLERAYLVVNSIFHADSLWSADVSLNRHVFDTVFRQVDNALVVVYQNDVPVDTLIHVDGGHYQSSGKRPTAGNAYEVRAYVQDYETATGFSYLPIPATLTEASFLEPVYVDGEFLTDMRIKFQDDGAIENFYEIIVETEQDYLGANGDIIPLIRYTLLETDDPVIESGKDNRSQSILLKDILFNGKQREVSFKAVDANFDTKLVRFRLKTISEDLYKYLSTIQVQNSTSDNPFAQPVNVYNNIENGFGIVAGYSQSTIVKARPKPSITSVSPMTGKAGDHVIITGSHFSDPHSSTYVMFTSAPDPHYPAVGAEVVQYTDTQIEIIIPADAVSGKIYVSAIGGIVAYEGFEVI